MGTRKKRFQVLSAKSGVATQNCHSPGLCARGGMAFSPLGDEEQRRPKEFRLHLGRSLYLPEHETLGSDIQVVDLDLCIGQLSEAGRGPTESRVVSEAGCCPVLCSNIWPAGPKAKPGEVRSVWNSCPPPRLPLGWSWGRRSRVL